MSIKTRTISVRRTLVAVAALLAVPIGGVALPAAALGTVSLSNPTLSADGNGDDYYAENVTPTAASTNLSANTEYLVGLCATASLDSMIPDCSTYTSATSDGSGHLSVQMPALEENGANVHGAIPGHPATVDCSVVDACTIAFVDHATASVDDTSASFYID